MFQFGVVLGERLRALLGIFISPQFQAAHGCVLRFGPVDERVVSMRLGVGVLIVFCEGGILGRNVLPYLVFCYWTSGQKAVFPQRTTDSNIRMSKSACGTRTT